MNLIFHIFKEKQCEIGGGAGDMAIPFRLSNLWYFVFHVFEEIQCEKGGADEMVLMKGWPSWAKQRKNGWRASVERVEIH